MGPKDQGFALTPSWGHTAKLAYTIQEAAQAVGLSPATIHRAIHTTDTSSFPPPLRAKRTGSASNGKYLITTEELMHWLDALPDA